MSHQELLVEAINMSEILRDNLIEATREKEEFEKKASQLESDKLALEKTARKLQEQLDNQVQLVKVAGAEDIPMTKIAAVADTLVERGFLPSSNKQQFQDALADQGADAILNTLQKVASEAIIPHSFKDEGSLVMDKAAAAVGSTDELLDDDQKVWASEFNIKVVQN